MLGKSTTQGKTWIVADTTNCGNKGANKGKNWKWDVESSQERNQKLSNSLQGRDISDWKDKIYTEERNEKIRKAATGRKPSEETRLKMKEAAKNRWKLKKE